MKKSCCGRWKRFLPIAAVLFLAIAARLALSLTNLLSPDHHDEVITLLMTNGVYPEVTECWECFQPQAFYRLSAYWLELVAALGFSTKGAGSIHSIQVMNSLLGVGTLLTILFWLSRIGLSRATVVFTFSLVALNSRFISVNGQVTNDTLAIFLSTVAMIGLHLYYLEQRSAYLYVSAVSIALAMFTKGSALACLGAFTVSLLFFPPRKSELSQIRRTALVAAIWCFAVFAGGYFSRALEYGSPFVINYGKPVDQVFEQNAYLPIVFDSKHYHSKEFDAKRPPWGTITWESFFTFRPVSLIKEPWNDIRARTFFGKKPTPSHMRSLWTQIFARANSVGFHPRSKGQGDSDAIHEQTSRGLFVCALAVLLVVLIALVRESHSFIPKFFAALPRRVIGSPSFIPLVVFFGSAAFAAVFNFRLGHFSGMKAVYCFPGMMAYLYFFAVGREWISQWKVLRTLLDVTVGLLLTLSLFEIGLLI
jgi:hypothetical protein